MDIQATRTNIRRARERYGERLYLTDAHAGVMRYSPDDPRFSAADENERLYGEERTPLVLAADGAGWLSPRDL